MLKREGRGMIACQVRSILWNPVMASFAPISRNELTQRRKQLRRQRRVQRLQALGRFAIVAGIASGAVWTVRQPIWVIHRAEQVKVADNKYLSTQTIQKLVPIKYPQSIFRIQPQQIVTTLKEKAPLAQVSVERQLFPPGLLIRITEQTPVATVYPQNPPPGQSADTPEALLDDQGSVIPLETYTGLEHNLQLPNLKVWGNPEQYRQKWGEFYRLIKSSAIPIQQIDWRNPSNLILTTDLGVVHLGTYGAGFPQQLRAIDSLRKISEKVPKQQIAYIDLRNPNAPAIQKKAGAKPTEAPPEKQDNEILVNP
jgi:cell division protein FtsQ